MAPPAFSKPLDTARMFAFGALGLLLTGGVLAAMQSGASLYFGIPGGRLVSIDAGSLLVFVALGFAVCGAVYYAFPRITEKPLSKRLGTVHFWLSLAGVLLGLGYFQAISRVAGEGGVEQRLVEWLLAAGAFLILLGQAVFLVNLAWSLARRRGV